MIKRMLLYGALILLAWLGYKAWVTLAFQASLLDQDAARSSANAIRLAHAWKQRFAVQQQSSAAVDSHVVTLLRPDPRVKQERDSLEQIVRDTASSMRQKLDARTAQLHQADSLLALSVPKQALLDMTADRNRWKGLAEAADSVVDSLSQANKKLQHHPFKLLGLLPLPSVSVGTGYGLSKDGDIERQPLQVSVSYRLSFHLPH